jgi:hypothetical protein
MTSLGWLADVLTVGLTIGERTLLIGALIGANLGATFAHWFKIPDAFC